MNVPREKVERVLVGMGMLPGVVELLDQLGQGGKGPQDTLAMDRDEFSKALLDFDFDAGMAEECLRELG